MRNLQGVENMVCLVEYIYTKATKRQTSIIFLKNSATV